MKHTDSNIFREIDAEIGNNKLYVKQYYGGHTAQAYGKNDFNSDRHNDSGDQWTLINKADRVSPHAKKDVLNVVSQLSKKEIDALNDFKPEPIPDIQVSGDGEGRVNFPSGRVKRVVVNEDKEDIYDAVNRLCDIYCAALDDDDALFFSSHGAPRYFYVKGYAIEQIIKDNSTEDPEFIWSYLISAAPSVNKVLADSTRAVELRDGCQLKVEIAQGMILESYIKKETKKLKEEEMNAAEFLDTPIKFYNKVLSAERYAAAGYDYSNVDHAAEEAAIPNHDRAIIYSLAELGIKTKEDLANKLLEFGLTYEILSNIQTPYFENYYGKQTKNPEYAQPVSGITFDNVYAISDFFKLLPGEKTGKFWERKPRHDYSDEIEELSKKICKALEDPLSCHKFTRINCNLVDVYDGRLTYNFSEGMRDMLKEFLALVELYDFSNEEDIKDFESEFADWYNSWQERSERYTYLKIYPTRK